MEVESIKSYVASVQQELSPRLFCGLKSHPYLIDRTGNRLNYDNGYELSSLGHKPSSILKHYVLKVVFSISFKRNSDWVNFSPEIHRHRVATAESKFSFSILSCWTSSMSYGLLLHSVFHSFKTQTYQGSLSSQLRLPC